MGGVFSNEVIAPPLLYGIIIAISVVLVAAAVFFIIQRHRGLRFGKALSSTRQKQRTTRLVHGMLSVAAVSALSFGVVVLSSHAHALENCNPTNSNVAGNSNSAGTTSSSANDNNSNNGSNSSGTPSPIAAKDDIITPTPPAGMASFPAGSPFNLGYGVKWDGTAGKIVFYTSDGTADNGYRGNDTTTDSVSISVVGNDTGNLDRQTVDLDPTTPGVQQDVFVYDENSYYSLRYQYNPTTDKVTVTPNNDSYGCFGDTAACDSYKTADDTFWSDYTDAHPSDNNTDMDVWLTAYDSAYNIFRTQYAAAHSNVTLPPFVTVSSQPGNAIIVGSDDDETTYTPYTIRFPYTVKATDGTVTGASVVMTILGSYANGGDPIV